MSNEDLSSSPAAAPPRGPTLVFPRAFRPRRRHLPAPVRHIIVALMGMSVGLLASYALRYIGY